MMTIFDNLSTINRLMLTGCMVLLAIQPSSAQEFRSDNHRFRVEVVAEGLDHPWGMAFTGPSDLLITERTGHLRQVQDWRLLPEPVVGLPDIREVGQGGLLGITLDPTWPEERWVYLSYAGEENGRYGTEVLRGRLAENALRDIEVIFRATPKVGGGNHFGSRLVFAPDGTLYVSLGDRGGGAGLGRDQHAQQLNSHIGSLIRIHPDGSAPSDNPFINHPDARPQIYTYGNRNMQGMALNPETGEIWTHEHGPQGGDEINIMRAGNNYGWPVVTYGVNYGLGTRIGEGTEAPGLTPPIYKWVPSIAPSGMLFYSGKAFVNWKGNLFVGSLKFGNLVRLEREGDRIVAEERLLRGEFGRIRDVIEGPDGLIYLLTDERNGKLLRLRPAD